ncbi:MAG TPA: SUMF1/EgtB/PvdO family nonheme iron enzyme [Candidatus Omnitrophota bacterium]|nr:SUMF1/EgtB/PvdO family nonheme iron enzyme [Candidatus Omnitrophota bacterium]
MTTVKYLIKIIAKSSFSRIIINYNFQLTMIINMLYITIKYNFNVFDGFKKTVFAVVFFLFCLTPHSYANDLRIENVVIDSTDSEQKVADIVFDLSWENSWRNMTNWDAAWIFVKYSTDAGLTWSHATLKTSGTNPSGFDSGDGTKTDIIVSSDKKGCFVQRSFVGSGKVAISELRLLWDWGTDGLKAQDSVRIKVFGVEMVYIPEKSFYIGDGNNTTESQYAFHAGATNAAVQITNALVGNIRVDAGASDDAQITGSGIGIDGDGGVDTNNDGNIDNANFPVGYEAFYAMKYEITEGQWVDFFNTLNQNQRDVRDITSSSGKNSDAVVDRNTVGWGGLGDASTQRTDRACGYLSWMDLCAYADWAALRPLTELEFEKAARGSNTPNLNEYAWGSDSVVAARAISGSEDGTETISTSGANCCYDNVAFSGGDGGNGPVRAGIFATEISTREDAGAGYYGVMELSGNLSERCVTLGNSAGRKFAGSNGDGALNLQSGFEGNATNSDWPGYVESQGVVGAAGSGLKGGNWQDTDVAGLQLSYRGKASQNDDSRQSGFGGRCARTAQ